METIEEDGFTITCLASAKIASGSVTGNKVIAHCAPNYTFMPIMGGTFTGDITAPTANFTNLNVANPPWAGQISALETRIAALEAKA